LASLGHPSKFQPVSHLAFVTAATSLTGGQPNCARCLASGDLAPTEFCVVQNSLYVQVLRSPILAALLHRTPAAGISQTLQHGTRNGIMELSQKMPPKFGRAAATLGTGPHSSYYCSASSTILHQSNLHDHFNGHVIHVPGVLGNTSYKPLFPHTQPQCNRDTLFIV